MSLSGHMWPEDRLGDPCLDLVCCEQLSLQWALGEQDPGLWTIQWPLTHWPRCPSTQAHCPHPCSCSAPATRSSAAGSTTWTSRWPSQEACGAATQHPPRSVPGAPTASAPSLLRLPLTPLCQGPPEDELPWTLQRRLTRMRTLSGRHAGGSAICASRVKLQHLPSQVTGGGGGVCYTGQGDTEELGE